MPDPRILPMIIDSFAGGGGASTGIELALGRSPDVAIDHSAAALALHAANHPDTLHLDSNIWDVAPREVTKGRPVGLLWASPDCKHFSKAKGGAPKDRNIRDLAWVIVRWMEEVRPDVVAMENVEEFRTWGPLDNDGQPITEFIGQTFDDWCRRIRKSGYRMQWKELRACDYGAPTIRKRFFMIARRDGRPITWPKPSHGDPKSPEVKLLPWRTAAECIDFTLPCPSIFDTAPEIMAKHGLRAVRPLKSNTLARVARGVKRYVLDAGNPFLVSLKGTDRRKDQNSLIAPFFAKYYGTGDGSRADEPLHTITVKDRMAHVQVDLAPPSFGPQHHARARQVADFLRAEGAWDGGEFVTLTIAGVDYVMTDIGMRMLTPRELFNAQGFEKDYVIEGVWDLKDGDYVWRPFPKDVQVSCCGNSVSPPIAEAIVRANCQHLMQERIAA